MKKFIYLIQGQADLVNNYLELTNRSDADVIFLTYDKPVENMIFFPKSTWAEGRNKLLEQALIKGKYHYYIFCDDDIEFEKGSWDIFEDSLMRLKPAIGVPIFPKTKKDKLPILTFQLFTNNDQQLMGFSYEVVVDNVVIPYQTQFDDTHWWAACEIQDTLIQTFYPTTAIQFNNIQISNTCHDRYLHSKKMEGVYKQQIKVWLTKQYGNNYKKIYKSRLLRKFISLIRTLKFLLFK